ncbi:MAG: class I SAM-dependent methyltransferase [Deltaproteobacteria bacterium]|nr:class I SAM-dependent methyltransferase [Deltaproteobacteria bacterium]
MERATYEIEALVERDHWWFRGRRKLLSSLLANLDPPLAPSARVLDVGCGTGANGPVLTEYGREVIGIDASSVPLGIAGTAQRGHTVRVRGDACSLPFASESFDLVVALDVLEHLEDDHAAARELFRVMRPGGALIVFVPALRILWGLQDDVSHHVRRYDKDELRLVVLGAGLDIQRLTFFNTFLFPPILAARLAMRVFPPRHLKSENEIGGKVANAILAHVFSWEVPVLEWLDFPVGVSLACVARRPPRGG